jgi:hypothetical protein
MSAACTQAARHCTPRMLSRCRVDASGKCCWQVLRAPRDAKHATCVPREARRLAAAREGPTCAPGARAGGFGGGGRAPARYAPEREAPQGTVARPGRVAQVLSAEETERAVSAAVAAVPEQLQVAARPLPAPHFARPRRCVCPWRCARPWHCARGGGQCGGLRTVQAPLQAALRFEAASHRLPRVPSREESRECHVFYGWRGASCLSPGREGAESGRARARAGAGPHAAPAAAGLWHRGPLAQAAGQPLPGRLQPGPGAARRPGAPPPGPWDGGAGVLRLRVAVSQKVLGAGADGPGDWARCAACSARCASVEVHAPCGLLKFPSERCLAARPA